MFPPPPANPPSFRPGRKCSPWLLLLLLAGWWLPAAGRCQEWSGDITIPNPAAGENAGKPLPIRAWIPDLGKPVRAVMVNSLAFDDPDWRAVAREFHCMMIQLPLNYNEFAENTKKILAVLARASEQFPEHPEIEFSCVSLFGWSQTSAGACRIASQPEMAGRVLAVVAIHEIDPPPWLPPLSVPHLFLSAAGDFYSELEQNVENADYSHDAAARSRATDEGAPLTMVADVNHGHSDVYGNYAFTRVWLGEVFRQRLPATPPVSAPPVLPDWQNHPGWLGTYDLAKKTNFPPWGNEQRLINVAVSPRAEYKDSRKFIWLPSRHCAEVWKVYSEEGVMPDEETLKPPRMETPRITAQPVDVSILPEQKFAFTARVTGTPSPTYAWWREKDGEKKVISTMPNCFNSWDPTTEADNGATFYLVASNAAGQAVSDRVTLTFRTDGKAPPSILVQPAPGPVGAGGSASLRVRVQGTPTPVLQWRKNGVEIPGATGDSLAIPSVSQDDAGAAFDVVAENPSGRAVSYPTRLAMPPAPQP